jgi:hypothetical protein
MYLIVLIKYLSTATKQNKNRLRENTGNIWVSFCGMFSFVLGKMKDMQEYMNQ